MKSAARSGSTAFHVLPSYLRDEPTITPSATRRLSLSKLEHCRPDVLIMHPGPVNRGVELAPEVADSPYSVILDQVSNGVAVRMAVLYMLAGSKSA